MSSEQTRPVQVFFSYAHRDKALRDRLEEHLSNLKYRGLITAWHDREITAGEKWIHQIDVHLNTADIILLLISSSFIASEYCYGNEMKRALERHEAKEARVVPIILRPVVYTDAPFAKLQFLPTDGKPVVIWRNRDSAFVNIAIGIQRVVEEYHALKISSNKPLPHADTTSLSRWQGGMINQPTGSSPVVPYQAQRPLQQQPTQFGNANPNVPSFQAPQQLYASQPSLPVTNRPKVRSRSFSRIGLILLVIGGLLTVVILLAQHPQAISSVLILVTLLLLLIGLLSVVRILIKRTLEKQERRIREQTRRVEQQRLEEEQRQREARRRQQEVERQQREALYRQLEEEEQRAKERTYYLQALDAYERALLRDPTDVTALKGKANALAGLERYNEALQVFEKAVFLDPTPAAYIGKGKMLSKLKQYDESLKAYEQAIRLNRTYAEAYTEMAEVLEQLGKTERAKLVREKAKELDYEE